jgi:hypothetical protein
MRAGRYEKIFLFSRIASFEKESSESLKTPISIKSSLKLNGTVLA